MRITFDPAFDQGSWPGPIAQGHAASGEIWLGPSGLLSILETMTGLAGPTLPPAVRAAELVSEVRSIKGFWKDSAQVDPFGTARRLLEWRDFLWTQGWRGQPVSLRLEQLAEVTYKASPGFPDRFLEVAGTMQGAANVIEALTLLVPVGRLNPALRTAVQALERTGTKVIEKTLEPASPKGDLGACRTVPFRPIGDGSLQLLRPATHSMAAHELAAWLSNLESLERTVIIGPDSVLDEALHRFDLPTTGAGIPASDHALLQILPLTLAMAWDPPDPQRALELLMLPNSPVPKGIGRRLAHALQDYPAVGSDAWNEALEEGLNQFSDKKDRKRLKDRMDAIFARRIQSRNYPVTEIKARIDLLRSWAKGRMGEDASERAWQALIAQLENCMRIAELSGLSHFTAPQIRRMLYEINEAAGSFPLYEAQAGLETVGAPECIAEQAQNVIWWSFNRGAAPVIASDMLTAKERSGLEQVGVVLPRPGDEAVWAAERWQRPLMLAGSNLILVCARRGPDGEEQYPHPLWDELAGRVEESTGLKELEREFLISHNGLTRTIRPIRSLPEPVWEWGVIAGAVAKRPKESPNSLSSLISCPFSWVVRYLGNLYGGATATLDSPEKLQGRLIHEILTRVLSNPGQTPEEAADDATLRFGSEGPLMAAQLFLPGYEDIRAEVKMALRTAAHRVFRLIKEGRFTVRAVEQTYATKSRSLGIEIEGRPDLVLKNPDAIVDFKRGGVNYRKEELAGGTSLQLAVYGHLIRKNEKTTFPPVAYLMLKSGQVITVDPKAFPDARIIGGPSPEETWKGTQESFKRIWDEMKAGKVRASGNDPDGPPKSQLDDGRLFLKPCEFCDFAVLCGRAFSE